MITPDFTPSEALTVLSGLSLFVKFSESGGDTVADAAYEKVLQPLAAWRIANPADAAMLDAEFAMRKRFDRGEIG